MFTNSNEAKSAAGSKGHSPTINGLFYTIPNYMKETNKQKKNTSTNLYIQVWNQVKQRTETFVDASSRWYSCV